MIEIKKELNKIIFVDEEQNKEIGFVEFSEENDSTITLQHTYVENEYRGKGYASKLMDAFYDHCKKNNLKAKLDCGYAINWFNNHPECFDIIDK